MKYIMNEALSNLNDGYKQKKKEVSSKEENKIITKTWSWIKKIDKFWDKLDKEYQKLEETQTFDEVKEELNDNQQQF